METITLPKKKYEELLSELERLREKNEMIIKKPTNDLALLSEESFAETWLNEKEDEAWREL